MESRSPHAHFRVRSGDVELFDSSLSSARGWQGVLPRGDVEISVFLSEGEARRLGSAEYSLQIEVH